MVDETTIDHTKIKRTEFAISRLLSNFDINKIDLGISLTDGQITRYS